MKKYDYIVIGSGPGGYASAIRASQLGFKVALVERYQSPGGTCLNVGCIPSKALLDSSELFYKAKNEFSSHGVLVSPRLDFSTMIKNKEKVVDEISLGLNYLFKKNRVDFINGLASFKDNRTIRISGNKKFEEIWGENLSIVTGSKPVELAFLKYSQRVISSTEALSLAKVPKSLLIIGGGVIGLELGSVYARLGSKVTVIEHMDKLLHSMDEEIVSQLQKSLEKIGIEFLLSAKVVGAEEGKDLVKLSLEFSDGKSSELSGEYVLVSVGRKPFTQGLNLSKANVETDEGGFIKVNEKLQTSQGNIYSFGDVIGGAMLAHKAEEEGIFVAEVLAGQKPDINYNLIPSVVYTSPELAFVGMSEEELKEKSIPYKVGKFPFKANGRAKASFEEEGLVKVLAHSKTDEVLGAYFLGARCADLVQQAVIAMEFRASSEDIARICFPHPTFSEAFKEACLALDKRAIHM